MLPNFAWIRPVALKDAARAAAEDGARVHAGGTDLLGCLHDGIFGATTVVSLSGLTGLSGIAPRKDGGLSLGALTPIATVAADETVRARYPVLAEAAGAVASPQLRNQGTLGGNLCQKPRCWYYRGDFDCLRKGGDTCYAVEGDSRYHCLFAGSGCHIVHPSDTAHALLALDARLRLVGPKGERTVPLDGFHVRPADDFTRETILKPGELVAEILVPKPAAGTRSRYRKVRARRAWDFAVVGSALALTFSGDTVRRARVVLAGVAPVPWRAEAAEKVLVGSSLTDGVLERAADAAVKGAQPMRDNAYKVPLVRGMLLEELRALRS